MQDALRETESSLQDFMESSKELEAEMEREISSSNKTISDLQRKNEILKGDVDEWKVGPHSRIHLCLCASASC